MIQITSDNKRSTGDANADAPPVRHGKRWNWNVIEAIGITLLFAAVAGQLPPDVNESHYLTKAKHFWNPQWCEGDLFLSSAFSHWLFYVAFGWLTKFMSLSAFAWTGRVLTWLMIAFAWQRLSRTLIPTRFFAILSAAFFLLLNERFNLAGEWIVGGFEAKGIAYACVILGLSFVAENRWWPVWPTLGVASLFHVLVGGWAIIATLFALCCVIQARKPGSLWTLCLKTVARNYGTSALITLTLLAAAAIPPLLSDAQAMPHQAAMARSIYVNLRISHHLTFAAFPASHMARFSILLLFGFFLYHWISRDSRSLLRRVRPLAFFALGTLIIAYAGLLLSGLAELGPAASQRAAGLLRFYWFRIADFAVPAVLSLATCLVLNKWLIFGPRKYHRLTPFAFAGVMMIATGAMIAENYADPRSVADQCALPTYDRSPERTRGTWRNWKRVCSWIRDNTPTDAVFITPSRQQTFKWYAGRHEVVAWKDIPQNAASIIEWRNRVAELYETQNRYVNGLLQYTDDQLLELAAKYGATHLLIPQYQVDATLGGTDLRQIYPANPSEKVTYAVFELSSN